MVAAGERRRSERRRRQLTWTLRSLSLGACGVIATLGCGDQTLSVAPVIEAPAPGSDADPFPDLDSVLLELAESGEDSPLLSVVFARGEPLLLEGAPLGDRLVLHLTGRIGATDVAYGRTCAFALDPNQAPPQPRLYLSRTVKWADAPSPVEAERSGGAGYTASDGSVVFVGGHRVSGAGAGEPAVAVDRYDPASGTVASVATLSPRLEAISSALGDARIVVLGGTEAASTLTSTYLELVDPLASEGRRVERLDDPRLGRLGATATSLSDGEVIVVGGQLLDAAGVTLSPAASAELISSAGAGATLRTVRGTLATPRFRHTATRLSNDLGAPVLIAGGLDIDGNPVAAAELYKPLREDFASAATFQPQLLVPRSEHRAVRMADGSVLIVGGLDASGDPVRQLELFSLDTGFVDAGTLPATAGGLEVNLATLPDGRILLSGGRQTKEGPALATAFVIQLDPQDGSVDIVATDALATARAAHAAATLCDGTIVVVGGGASSVAERYSPPALGRR